MAVSEEIIQRPNNSLITGLLIVSLLANWAIGAYFLAQQFTSNDGIASLLAYTALVLWVAFGAFLLFSLAWIAAGAQVVSVFDGRLAVASRIGPITIGRRKIFDVVHVHNMRLETYTTKYRGKTKIEHAIVFDYSGQKQTLLVHLSKERGEIVLKDVLEKIYP